MKPFALLTAAGLKKCHHRQLLLLLFSSLAAKTQIYSQEVAFNCHFLLRFAAWLFPSTRRRGAVPWKRMQRSLLFCSCFGYVEILQFLLALPRRDYSSSVYIIQVGSEQHKTPPTMMSPSATNNNNDDGYRCRCLVVFVCLFTRILACCHNFWYPFFCLWPEHQY
uniref:(northern house mosquito) hypothetical protein n=1 Tax=Culex pipiens TaxID=7175 RepID=A0A8D8AH64_CULPI